MGAYLFRLYMHVDPYLNTDAGTMSPFEHGEVFVLDDGGEVSPILRTKSISFTALNLLHIICLKKYQIKIYFELVKVLIYRLYVC